MKFDLAISGVFSAPGLPGLFGDTSGNDLRIDINRPEKIVIPFLLYISLFEVRMKSIYNHQLD